MKTENILSGLFEFHHAPTDQTELEEMKKKIQTTLPTYTFHDAENFSDDEFVEKATRVGGYFGFMVSHFSKGIFFCAKPKEIGWYGIVKRKLVIYW